MAHTTMAATLAVLMPLMWEHADGADFDFAKCGFTEGTEHDDAAFWARSLGGRVVGPFENEGEPPDLWVFPDGSYAAIITRDGRGIGLEEIWHDEASFVAGTHKGV